MHNRTDWVELAEREADGVAVSLVWRRCDGGVAIRWTDHHRGASSFVRVPGECALDALRHPASYIKAARRNGFDPPLDVDELWLEELAATLVSELEKLLMNASGGGEPAW